MDSSAEKILTRQENMRLLKLMILAFRPLHRKEIQSLIGLNVSYDAIDSLVAHCGLFINFQGESIEFIHQSARDFLMGQRDKASHSLPDESLLSIDLLTGSRSEQKQGIKKKHYSQRVGFSPRGDYMMSINDKFSFRKSGMKNQSFKLWTLNETPVQIIEETSDPPHEVAFSFDGSCMAGASSEIVYIRKVKTWDIQAKFNLNDRWGEVSRLAFSPNGKYLAIGRYSGAIFLIDAATGTFIKSLFGHTESRSSLSFTPESETLVSGSDDFTVKLWSNLEHSQGEQTIAPSILYWISLIRDSNKMIEIRAVDDLVQVNTLLNGDVIKRTTLHPTPHSAKDILGRKSDAVSMATFFNGSYYATSRRFAVISLDQSLIALRVSRTSIGVWSLQKQSSPIFLVKTLLFPISAFVFSPVEPYFASGSLKTDAKIKIYGTARGNLIVILRPSVEFRYHHGAGVGAIGALEFSPDGKYISASYTSLRTGLPYGILLGIWRELSDFLWPNIAPSFETVALLLF